MNELSQLIGFEEDDSDIQKLNQAAGLDWISLDSRTISILDKAEKVAQDSGGAFSPTIVPILNLWGIFGIESFGSNARKNRTGFTLCRLPKFTR